jgi:hypothetical protein
MAHAASALSSVLARAKDAKDSVELLLDGMTGPRPERRKTTPQSDGEASASYHARHGVHPGHAVREPGPKVVVERAPAAAPLPDPDTVPTPPPPAVNAADTTFVPSRALGRRIAMAVLAALLIVLAAFIALDLASSRTQIAAHVASPAEKAEPVAANANPAAVRPSPATPPLGPDPVFGATSNAAPVGPPPATAPPEAEVAKPAVTVQAEGAKHRRRGSGDSDDIGEFKTSF